MNPKAQSRFPEEIMPKRKIWIMIRSDLIGPWSGAGCDADAPGKRSWGRLSAAKRDFANVSTVPLGEV
jgi:hypothetical protein